MQTRLPGYSQDFLIQSGLKISLLLFSFTLHVWPFLIPLRVHAKEKHQVIINDMKISFQKHEKGEYVEGKQTLCILSRQFQTLISQTFFAGLDILRLLATTTTLCVISQQILKKMLYDGRSESHLLRHCNTLSSFCALTFGLL